MIRTVSTPDFLFQGQGSILDVRTPAEYRKGHIPGAINFPLFSDEERILIGTLYKQEGRVAAVRKGLDLIAPRITNMFNEGLMLGNAPRVHCWRGGMRSYSVAWLLSLAGGNVRTLDKGYKAFRQWVATQFRQPRPMFVLGGYTGSGKTDVLRALHESGAQTIDLEAIADHKGSAFGRLGATREVTQEQFENDLAWHLHSIGSSTAWIEDESRNFSSIVIPGAFWEHMRNAPLIVVDVPLECRVKRLVVEYGSFPPEILADGIQRIAKRLGGQRMKEALESLHAGDLAKTAEILLEYYDRTYTTGMKRKDGQEIYRLKVTEDEPVKTAALLMEMVKDIG